MDEQEVIRKLNTLVQLNLDVAYVYEQARERIDLPGVRERLTEIRDEHQRRALDLSAEIYAIGGAPLECPQTTFGLSTEGLRSVSSQADGEEIFKILEADEQVAGLKYHAAQSWDLPASSTELIRRQHDGEGSHLRFIREEIGKKIWVT